MIRANLSVEPLSVSRTSAVPAQTHALSFRYSNIRVSLGRHNWRSHNRKRSTSRDQRPSHRYSDRRAKWNVGVGVATENVNLFFKRCTYFGWCVLHYSHENLQHRCVNFADVQLREQFLRLVLVHCANTAGEVTSSVACSLVRS